MPNVTFWTYKKTIAVWPKTAPAPQPNSRALRDGPGLRATFWTPVPNVTFWSYKKTSCLSCLPAAKSFTNGASATPKQQGPEGRTGPAGHRSQCLTSLSEPTRKLYSCLTQNGACATAKQQGPEGRTGPAGHGPQCLTSLSEPTRKLAVWPTRKLAVWPKTAPAPQQNSRALGTDRACGPRPPVPNVTFWTYKKTIAVWPKTAPAPQPNSKALKDGPGLRATAQCLTSLSEPTRKLAVWAVFQPPKASQTSQTAPPPHQNSRALRDGPGLRATAPSA